MKNRLFARSLIVMVFAVIALALGGCPGDNDDMTGGGWIVTGGKKVNFGFNFKCKCDDNGIAKVTGQLQYYDRDAGVRFHGVADSLYEGDYDGLLNTWEGRYCGNYTPQPRNLGDGGRFQIEVVDKGKKGPSKEDTLTLTLEGGVYGENGVCGPSAYNMTATLAGGNIQAHGAKERE